MFRIFPSYSYLPNKRGGEQNSPKGEAGKMILIHKNSCQGWKNSQNQINGEVDGGI